MTTSKLQFLPILHSPHFCLYSSLRGNLGKKPGSHFAQLTSSAIVCKYKQRFSLNFVSVTYAGIYHQSEHIFRHEEMTKFLRNNGLGTKTSLFFHCLDSPRMWMQCNGILEAAKIVAAIFANVRLLQEGKSSQD